MPYTILDGERERPAKKCETIKILFLCSTVLSFLGVNLHLFGLYRCDVSDENEVFKMAEKVKREVGDVTILVNNAGIAPVRTFQNYNIKEISQVINVNLMAHYWASIIFEKN